MPETLVEQPEIVEQPQTPETPAPLPEVPEEQKPAASIAEHANLYGPQAKKEREAAATPQAGTPEQTPVPQKEKPRAAKARASAADVPRINALTGKLRTTEEQLAIANAELARYRSNPPAPNGNGHQSQAAAQTAQQQQRYVDPRDPEPQVTDAKFGNDYGAYLREFQRWAARDEIRQVQYQGWLADQAKAQTMASEQRQQFWGTRLEKARADYDDFDAVVFGPQAHTPWKKDSLIDALIERDDNGIDLLYYLHTHPQERDSILQMPEHKQNRALTQILLRFESTGASAAGGTGSAPASNIRYLPPRPSNPVRTEAQAAGGSPLSGEPTSIAAHAKLYGPQARRR